MLVIITKTYQILSFKMSHFVNDSPEPAFEAHEPLGWLAALVVEARIRDQRGHVDVAHAVQQQPQVFRGQALQGGLGQHVQYSYTYRLKVKMN